MEMFKADLDLNLKCTTSFEYSDFQSTSTPVHHNHAPTEKKILWPNNSLFTTKTLRKAIMHRCELENIYSKNGLMIVGQTIKNKGISVLTCCVKPKQTISRN